MSEREFERLGGETVHDGTFISLRVDRFRYPDGEEVTREIVSHPGAVGMVVHDDEHVWLVRQPREAVDDPDSLEVPAGKLDPARSRWPPPGASWPRRSARPPREWEPLTWFHTSVGVMDETLHLFLATGLSDADADADEHERIEIVRWPLADLDGAIAATRDAKTIIGLLLLRDRLR